MIGFVLAAVVGVAGTAFQYLDTAQPPTPLPPEDLVAVADGNVARCNNGSYSDNTDFDATCSSNDGVDYWLATYGQCDDGEVVAMSEDADCDDHDGFEALLPPDYVPQPEAADVARCKNGTYSDNTNFESTCSSSGGVDAWLSSHGQCRDGTVVELSASTDCGDHGGFGQVMPSDFDPTTAVNPAAGTAAPVTTVAAPVGLCAVIPTTPQDFR